MSTPTLTDNDTKTLQVLATRQYEPSVRMTSGQVLLNDARAIERNMASIRANGCVDCGIDPIQDQIEYHSETVERGVDSELAFVEASESWWIAQSHVLACNVYNLQAEIAAHWDSCQNPHTSSIMDKTYSKSLSRNYTNTHISCTTLLSRVSSVQNSTSASSTRSVTRNYRRYRADSTQRPGSYLGTYVNHASISYITHHLMKWHDARRYMYHQNFGETANATYHAGRQSPDGMLQLMSNAQQLYADVAAGNSKTETQKSSGGSNAWAAIGTIAQIVSLFW